MAQIINRLINQIVQLLFILPSSITNLHLIIQWVKNIILRRLLLMAGPDGYFYLAKVEQWDRLH